MSYKIAVATSDGVNIDWSFGAAPSFVIYEVNDGGYFSSEVREFHVSEEKPEQPSSGCSGNGKSCGGHGGGCGGGSEVHSEKVLLVSDCRAVVCTKIGMHVQKSLQLKAISAFDVQCTVRDALDKITSYYARTDKNK